MRKRDFEQALHSGLGRAVLWLRSGAVPEDRELILRACLENWACDLCMDSNRAPYMAGIVSATRDPEFYIAPVLKTLAADRDSDNYDQRYDLAAQFAAAGSAEARDAVFAAFTSLRTASSSLYAEALLDIDGLAGYQFVIQNWVREGLSENDDFSEIQLLDEAEERYGADAVAAAIDAVAHSDREIAAYHASVKARRNAWREGRRKRPPRPTPTYDYLNDILRRPSPSAADITVWAHRGRLMGAETATRFAKEALSETDPALRSRMLSLFGEYKFPGDPKLLLALAHGGDEAIARASALALSALTIPDVRDLGLAIMQNEREPWRGLRLLRRNFQPVDCAAMLHLLERTEDAVDIHTLGIEIGQVFKKHPLPEFAEVLTLLYEKGMCAHRRSSVVDCLIRIDALPEYIIQEGPYDASNITRGSIRNGMLT